MDVFFSYEAEFIQVLLKKNEKKLARSFNFTFRYIDDVLYDKWNISVVICDTDIP
jgi:hypothetical protein